jgi:hypothetical protein
MSKCREMTEAHVEIATAIDTDPREETYRRPRLFRVGKAVDVVQQSASGHLRDGYGAWYIFGS